MTDDELPEVRQILVSAGPLWDDLRAWFLARGLRIYGPLPSELEDEIPTYALQPTAELWASVQAERSRP